jgi:hypothetical protein
MAKDVNKQKAKREKYSQRRRYNPDDEEYPPEQAEGPVGQL